MRIVCILFSLLVGTAHGGTGGYEPRHEFKFEFKCGESFITFPAIWKVDPLFVTPALTVQKKDVLRLEPDASDGTTTVRIRSGGIRSSFVVWLPEGFRERVIACLD